MASIEITSPAMLDETGQAIKDAILQVASAIHAGSGAVYGFHIDGAESDPDARVTYLKDAIGMAPASMNFTTGEFDYGSWGDAFFMPRPCMVKPSGVVDYYLDPDDYTKKEDGTASDIANTSYDGNAMMEWGKGGKKIWMKITPSPDGKSADVFIADHKADGLFRDYPFHNSKGVPVDHFYTAIYNGSVVSGKMRSLSGQQASNKTTADNEITYAKANNPGSDIIWNTELHSDIDLINMLLVLMAKTTDTQTAYGKGLIDSGTEAINNAFRTGVHNAKGLFYGTNSGAAATYTNAVKVFGMENWWGFQWRRYQGHVMVNGVQKVKNTYGTEDGSTVDGYNLTGDGFKATGAAAPSGTSGGYISQEHFTEDGMFPEIASGSESTHYCDGLWFDNSITAVPLRGGDSYRGALCGAFCVSLCIAASRSTWDFGAALSCKPLA